MKNISNKPRDIEFKSILDDLKKVKLILATGLAADLINKYSTFNGTKIFFYRWITKLFSI